MRKKSTTMWDLVSADGVEDYARLKRYGSNIAFNDKVPNFDELKWKRYRRDRVLNKLISLDIDRNVSSYLAESPFN